MRDAHQYVNVRCKRKPSLGSPRAGLAVIDEVQRDPATHALRGALFETWVLGEMLKHGCNRGEAPELQARFRVLKIVSGDQG